MPGRDLIHLLHSSQDRDACEVDLHGLYVKEAVAYSDKTITDARRRADPEVRLIVGMCISSVGFEVPSSKTTGQGNHSEGGVSRLKPAIQEDLQS